MAKLFFHSWTVTFFQLESACSSLVVLFSSLVKGLSALLYNTSTGVTLAPRRNSASKKFQGLEVLSLQDSLHHNTLRVLVRKFRPTRDFLRMHLHKPNVNSLQETLHFLLSRNWFVNSNTPTWPTYNESSKGHARRSQGQWVQKNHLTQTSSDSLCPRDRLCSRDSFYPQGWESQDPDWQRCGTASFYLTLRDMWSFSNSCGICFGCNQEKRTLQGPRRSQWSLCGGTQTGEAGKSYSGWAWWNH